MIERLMTRRAALCLSLLAAGCATTEPATPSLPEAPPPVRTHENLNATLWVQTAAEYAAATRSLYTMGQHLIDVALEDTVWSADPQQQRAGGYGALPTAIVMDVDETVLDNSAYQARLVEDDTVYARASWNAWVEEVQATPVPGAAEFVKHARARGVVVFFVTNRTAELEAATQANLEAYDFGTEHHMAGDVLLMRGERPEWDTSDKEPRRAFVRENYRVILYVGDNLGDFVSGENTDLEARQKLVAPYEKLWGRRWLMVPNPTYGSWEGALYDFDYALSPDTVRTLKYRRLQTLRDAADWQPGF